MTDIIVNIEKTKEITVNIDSLKVIEKQEQSKTVDAVALGQTILPDEGKVLSSVVQNPIENLTPENVRLGVRIANVEGNLEPDKPDQSKTVYPSNMQQIVSADIGYELSSVVVEPVLEQQKTVNPTTQQQIVVPDTGKWLSEVTVNPILLQTKTVEPSTQSLEVLPDSGYDGLDLVNVGAVTASIDSNIQPQNIVQGIDILGISGIAKGSGYARPSCWLTEPTFNETIDEIYILLAIFNQDDTYNNCPLNVWFSNGNCYVDWGDGSIAEQITSNVQFNHTYKYGDISESNYCTERGYKMVWCRIYGDIGTTITDHYFQQTYSPATYANFLEIYGNVTSIYRGNIVSNLSETIIRQHQMLEIYKMTAKGNGSLGNATYRFNNLPRLKYIDLNGVLTSSSNMTVSSLGISYIHIYSLVASAINMGQMFTGCWNCDTIIIDNMTNYPTSSYPIFNSQHFAPKVLKGLNLGSSYSLYQIGYSNTYFVESLTIPNYAQSFFVSNTQMSAEALNELFTSLGIVSGKTVDITNATGVFSCDRTIATNKGWTVIG